MNSVLHFLASWFGYVGSCVAAPDATCRPLLAFVALGVSASAGLLLIVLAYRHAHAREMSEVAARRASLRAAQTQERVRRAAVPQAIRAAQPLRSALHAAV